CAESKAVLAIASIHHLQHQRTPAHAVGPLIAAFGDQLQCGSSRTGTGGRLVLGALAFTAPSPLGHLGTPAPLSGNLLRTFERYLPRHRAGTHEIPVHKPHSAPHAQQDHQHEYPGGHLTTRRCIRHAHHYRPFQSKFKKSSTDATSSLS